MKRSAFVSIALVSALVASCKSSPEGADEYLNVVDESELLTVDQAALQAEEEITLENLDSEFAKLKAELDEDR